MAGTNAQSVNVSTAAMSVVKGSIAVVTTPEQSGQSGAGIGATVVDSRSSRPQSSRQHRRSVADHTSSNSASAQTKARCTQAV